MIHTPPAACSGAKAGIELQGDHKDNEGEKKRGLKFVGWEVKNSLPPLFSH
jgi:hypothetical protein